MPATGGSATGRSAGLSRTVPSAAPSPAPSPALSRSGDPHAKTHRSTPVSAVARARGFTVRSLVLSLSGPLYHGRPTVDRHTGPRFCLSVGPPDADAGCVTCRAEPDQDPGVVGRRIASIRSRPPRKNGPVVPDDFHARPQHVATGTLTNKAKPDPVIAVADVIDQQ